MTKWLVNLPIFSLFRFVLTSISLSRSFPLIHLWSIISTLCFPCSLQRFINRSKPQLSKDQQQNLTRWAVSSIHHNNGQTFFSATCSIWWIDEFWPYNGQKMMQVLFAGSLIKNNKAIHEALMTAMSKKGTVLECIEAIEKA